VEHNQAFAPRPVATLCAVTSTLAGPTSSGALGDEAPAADHRVLTGTDLLAGGAVLAVALLAWASLVLAHLGVHSLAGAVGLGLAMLGVVGVLAVLAGRRHRVRLAADPAGIVVAVLCAAVAAALTFPGFSYGVTDKDPGGYVAHAVEIAHSGDYTFTDPLLADRLPNGQPLDVQLASPGARFPGVWIKDAPTGKIVPQFYHLWPALLATAYDVGGYDGIRFAVPLMGVLAVLLLVALLRRLGDAVAGPTAGLVAAGAGGLLLATNMLQVWQARYPTTEVLAEALYLASLLGIVIALQTGWRPAAGLAGLFVGIGWLNRADALLLVLLSVGVGAALLATRRWDSRATWYAAGLAVVVPHAVLQAYDLARFYTLGNNVPTLSTVVAVTVGLSAAALVCRLLLRRPIAWLLGLLEHRSTQVVAGLVVLVGATGLMALGFLRARLFGADYFLYNGASVRSYDEQILTRLAWFFTVPGFVLMLLGLAVVAVRRWSGAVWAVVVPSLLLFAVYAYTAKNSTRLLWWTRRYVPTVLPGILVLVALALAFAFVWRFRGRAVLRVPSVLALVALVAVFLSQSWPLRAHDEWKGSLEISQQIADLSGHARGVYLWEYQPCCNGTTQLFATPVWLAHGELSVLLPLAVENRTPIVKEYAAHFTGEPLFIVAGKSGLPAGLDPASVTQVAHITAALPMWDESDTERPSKARRVPVELRVWRVNGT
jgi:hypothetical protein